MKTVVVALLDKSWPPEHSFVDGMLVGEACRISDIKMRLCVSRVSGRDMAARRYGRGICLPRLYPRKHFGRILNFLMVLKLIVGQVWRERKTGRRVVLFVRNDPVYLLAASLLCRTYDRLVFQSSFPHEKYSGGRLKRLVARALFRFAGSGVDVVTGVSPEGVRRAHRICPNAKLGGYIPLLADFHSGEPVEVDKDTGKVAPIFIYAGTHSSERELEIVLKGVVRAVSAGTVAQFRFVGALQNDQRRLLQVDGVEELVAKGVIVIEAPIPRNDLLVELKAADVGISLIPPKEMYYEASPTKLAEYMGAGLAVLGSKGIPMQERFVVDSGGGLLVEWGVESIASGIEDLCADNGALLQMKKQAARYAVTTLNYKSYLPVFLKLIDHELSDIHSNNG